MRAIPAEGSEKVCWQTFVVGIEPLSCWEQRDESVRWLTVEPTSQNVEIMEVEGGLYPLWRIGGRWQAGNGFGRVAGCWDDRHHLMSRMPLGLENVSSWQTQTGSEQQLNDAAAAVPLIDDVHRTPITTIKSP